MNTATLSNYIPKLVWLTMLLLSLQAAAQTTRLKASAERNNLQTAEPVWITLLVESNQPRQLELSTDSLGPFTILDRQTGKPVTSNGSVAVEEKLLVAAFDSGSLVMPAFTLNTEAGVVQSNTLQFEVKPPPADSLQQFRPVKEWTPLGAVDNRWWWVLVIAAASAVLVYAWWRSTRAKQKKQSDGQPTTSRTKGENEWSRLEKQWRSGQLSSEQLANRWMQLFRQQSGFSPAARQTITAQEVLLQWQQSGRPVPAALAESLKWCEAAQFAQLKLEEDSGLKLIANGSQLTTRKEAAGHAE